MSQDSGAIVVGLMNWRLALPTMTADQLRAKTYKCDFAQGGIGKKLDKNWIPGDQFLGAGYQNVGRESRRQPVGSVMGIVKG